MGFQGVLGFWGGDFRIHGFRRFRDCVTLALAGLLEGCLMFGNNSWFSEIYNGFLNFRVEFFHIMVRRVLQQFYKVLGDLL